MMIDKISFFLCSQEEVSSTRPSLEGQEKKCVSFSLRSVCLLRCEMSHIFPSFLSSCPRIDSWLLRPKLPCRHVRPDTSLCAAAVYVGQAAHHRRNRCIRNGMNHHHLHCFFFLFNVLANSCNEVSLPHLDVLR